ncbi:Kunitz-type serine protease inhibitor APEKTx1 [Trichostrongylus colubriformis]|uniref:Kunitz-type serine protease inhibitor APEKTx1 n=1 Tax=Trichostrongylus colubriformis TaxID=6319 RepID=A0AAN8FN69_TRICO
MKLTAVLLIVFIGNAFSFESRCNEEIQPCRLETRYAYDSSLKRCRTFDWGGCEPNGNNFLSMQSCIAACHL